MQLAGTRFGTVEYGDQDVVVLLEGMIGFPDLQNFLVVPHRPGSPFQWLQSVDEPAMAFLTVDPFQFVGNYAPEVSDADADALGLDEASHRAVMVTASIPNGDASQMSVNLAAPIVINVGTRTGKQVVLDGEAYTIKHRFQLESPPAQQAA